MRIVSLILVLSFMTPLFAQEGEEKKQPQTSQDQRYAELLARIEELQRQLRGDSPAPPTPRTRPRQDDRRIPTTLAEAHAELERTLSKETLAEIDAMESEKDMIKYHFDLGLGIRNGWGLWQGSALAKHMQELGFMHPDTMSGVILNTFWCKRHGQDLRIEERAAGAKRAREAQRKLQEEEEDRVRRGKLAIQEMAMPLQFEKRDVPVVPVQTRLGLDVRFMWPFRDGVFITAYRRGTVEYVNHTEGYRDELVDGAPRLKPEYDDRVARGFCYVSGSDDLRKLKPGEDFYTVGCFFDPADGKIHRVCPREVDRVYAATVADGKAWFAGMKDQEAVLVGLGERDRGTVPLPETDEIPDLGLDGQSLLAVYCRTIYRLDGRQWTLVHSGDILLPRSGLPPLRHGNTVFFRDEERNNSDKRLWWLTMGEDLHLHLLACDMGLFEPIVTRRPGWEDIRNVGPPAWQQTSSYCVTSNGDLWACVGDGSFLLRRTSDGSYAFPIAYNSIQHTGDSPGSEAADDDVYVSAVMVLADDTLILAGDKGLYRLKDSELIQELAFTGPETSDEPDGTGRRLYWNPTHVLALDDRSYLIASGRSQGVYLLHKDDDHKWNAQWLSHDDKPIIW